MNCIKTKEWYNNIGIFFELCALDIHTQNGVVERFRRQII